MQETPWTQDYPLGEDGEPDTEAMTDKQYTQFTEDVERRDWREQQAKEELIDTLDLKPYETKKTGEVVLACQARSHNLDLAGIQRWPDKQGLTPRDMSLGYIDILSNRFHVRSGDYLVYSGEPLALSQVVQWHDFGYDFKSSIDPMKIGEKKEIAIYTDGGDPIHLHISCPVCGEIREGTDAYDENIGSKIEPFETEKCRSHFRVLDAEKLWDDDNPMITVERISPEVQKAAEVSG